MRLPRNEGLEDSVVEMLGPHWRIHVGLVFLALCILWGCSSDKSAPKYVETEKAESQIEIGYLSPQSIGAEFTGRPWITDLSLADVDGDGSIDVLFCDGRMGRVLLALQKKGEFEEVVISDSIQGAAHVDVADMDNDGDLDVLVASLGAVLPNNHRIGAVAILVQTKELVFEKRVVVEGVERVADVRAGDLDGDGDLDLSVAKFGYDQGEISWMENLGSWRFENQPLLSLPGGINCPIADFNNDGRLDIAAIVSQEWEEVYVFSNQGEGKFEKSLVYGSANEDYGSSGLSVVDLDEDGLMDLLYTNGDAFDYARPGPRPWHGVQWLRNTGDGRFIFKRLGDFPGAYSPKAVDLDGDGDLDILATSGFNRWEKADSVSLICFENTGDGVFEPRPLANEPTHLIDVEAADLDGDGEIELVTASFHAYPPYDRIARLTLWDR